MHDPHELPDNPVYAFCPKPVGEDDIHQIVIVFQDLPGYVPTAFHALTRYDAVNLCDKLNKPLGHGREAWKRIAEFARAESVHPGQVH